MSAPFTLAELGAAAELVNRYVPPTPQFAWPLLAEALGVEVWVKHENHTPTGAFKVRGGLVYVDRHVRRGGRRGIISATRGNHGQSMAFAGRAFGADVTIVAPLGNSPDKNAAMRAVRRDADRARPRLPVGARVRPGSRRRGGLRDGAVVPSRPRGRCSHVRTRVAARGSRTRHRVRACRPWARASAPTLRFATCSGCAPKSSVSSPSNAPATALSFAAGHVVSTERADTFIDGVACRIPDRGGDRRDPGGRGADRAGDRGPLRRGRALAVHDNAQHARARRRDRARRLDRRVPGAAGPSASA